MVYALALNDGTTLYHHGILGQKWGVRRYQYEDGTLTPAGYIHYGYSRRDKSSGELSENYKKSVRKSKNTALVVGGVALAALGVGVSYAILKNRSNILKQTFGKDYIIKRGLTINTINDIKTGVDVKRRFYTAENVYDKTKYAGDYSTALKIKNYVNMAKSGVKGADIPVYNTHMKITKDLNVASHSSAKKVLSELYNSDDEYKKTLKEFISYADDNKWGRHLNQRKMISRARKALEKDVIDDDVYNSVNYLFIYKENGGDVVQNKLFDALKKHNYQGLFDINDQKFSTYHTLRPIIAFDAAEHVTVSKVENMTYDKIAKARFLHNGQQHVNKILIGATGSLSVSAITAARIEYIQQQRNVINEYRKDHPGTKLTDEEILYNYYGK